MRGLDDEGISALISALETRDYAHRITLDCTQPDWVLSQLDWFASAYENAN